MVSAKHVMLNIGINVVNAFSAYLLALTASLTLLGFNTAFILSQLFWAISMYLRNVGFAHWRIPIFVLDGNPAYGYRLFGFPTPYPHLMLIAISLAFFLSIQVLTKVKFKRAIGTIFLLTGVATTILMLIAFITSYGTPNF